MSTIESALTALIIGPVVPIALFLLGWWTSFSVIPEGLVPVVCLVCLAIGGAIDIVFLRRWVRSAYSWNEKLLLAIFLFYSVCVFGFFMGVPVFNLAVGAVAGLFWGRTLSHLNANREQACAGAIKAARISALAIGLVSLASAYFATRDLADTARNLQGMLGLPFTPTNQMVIALIGIGGPALITVQYWMTKKAALWAYRIDGRSS